MNENSKTSAFETVEPGAVIVLSDMTELPAFEDMVAWAVEPNLYVDYWDTRKALRDLIRPANFNGNIVDIQLRLMPEPVERLKDAKARGWNLGAGGVSRMSEEQARACMGFEFAAQAESNGRGVIGQIQTELWYFRMPKITHKNTYLRKDGTARDYTHRSRSTPIHANASAIRRVVAKPKYNQEAFSDLHREASRIGFTVLQQAIMHPILKTMRE